jgi:ankyrin repeat protein
VSSTSGTDPVAERSLERVGIDDLRLLGALAARDRTELFFRNPGTGRLYADRLFAVALCQGAALHYLDGATGVKDFDVWSFYTESPVRRFPPRRRARADFGDPRFGVSLDSPHFIGRRVDLIGRSIRGADPADPVGSLQRYLATARSQSARLLARKAVILIEPAHLLGTVAWPAQPAGLQISPEKANMQTAEFIQLATEGEEADALKALEREPQLANARDSHGVSVVCLAVYRGRRALAEALAARRTDLDVFESACIGERARIDAALAADAAGVNAVSPDGFSPVGYAAFFGHVEVLRLLIERGGEVNRPSANAMRVSPVHSAAAHADPGRAVALARIVLEAGADPNARQQGGFTALHEAALNGNGPLVELLLAHGAIAGITNDAGQTPAELARSNGHATLADRLERAAA